MTIDVLILYKTAEFTYLIFLKKDVFIVREIVDAGNVKIWEFF